MINVPQVRVQQEMTQNLSVVSTSDIYRERLAFNVMPTKFQDKWLADPRFKLWISRNPASKYYANCVFCKQELDISTMGASGLTSHMRAAKHKILLWSCGDSAQPPIAVVNSKQRTDTGDQPGPSASPGEHATESSTETVAQPVNSCDMDTGNIASSGAVGCGTSSGSSGAVGMKSFYNKQAALEAEVYYAMNIIDKNQSFSSANGCNQLFRKMFYDSGIAKEFRCHETKCSYITNFALAPYVSDIISEQMRKCNTFVICFDESLNPYIHKKQMDFHVRMWVQNKDKKYISMRYLTSKFLGKAAAIDLENSFKALEISLAGMIQVSMDGPNVNLLAHSRLDDHMDDTYGYRMLNMWFASDAQCFQSRL